MSDPIECKQDCIDTASQKLKESYQQWLQEVTQCPDLPCVEAANHAAEKRDAAIYAELVLCLKACEEKKQQRPSGGS